MDCGLRVEWELDQDNGSVVGHMREGRRSIAMQSLAWVAFAVCGARGVGRTRTGDVSVVGV